MATAAVALPSPAGSHELALDNVQDLIKRKRDIEKNKSRYRLTESDADLLLANSSEYSFNDGQVIMEDGHENTALYRIKTGRVGLHKNGRKLCELGQGWFIGETILLDNKQVDIIEATLVAIGKVTICEINVSFMRKLFEADTVLAIKFYRNLASKLSAIFYAISGNLMSPCLVKLFSQGQLAQGQMMGPDSNRSITRSSSSSSTDSNGSNGSSGSSGSSGPEGSGSGSGSGNSSPGGSAGSSAANLDGAEESPVASYKPYPLDPKSDVAQRFFSCPNVPQASLEFAQHKRKTSKRKSVTITHSAYKVYTLDHDGKKGTQTCNLKHRKLTIKSDAFGFAHKKTIHYHKIRSIVKSSESAITIIFDPLKAKTLFFQSSRDAEEFYGLTLPLVENSSNHHHILSPGPLSHATDSPPVILKSSSDHHLFPLDSRDDESQRVLDRDTILTIATKLELKQGDTLFSEGDLYQRIYMIVKGGISASKNGKVVSNLKEGDVFGEGTLLHLRPAPVTATVTSETASVLIIPAYKLNELINSNPTLAMRVYKKVAGLVEKKIERVLTLKRNMLMELYPEMVKHVPSRLNL